MPKIGLKTQPSAIYSTNHHKFFATRPFHLAQQQIVVYIF